MNNDQSTSVCKSVRAMGFSKKRTHAVVDYCSRVIKSNGAQHLLDVLKSLTDYYLDPTSNPFPEWIKKAKRPDGLIRPRGGLGHLVGSKTDRKTVITLLGTVRTAIVFESPTPKQLEKFSNAVLNPPASSLKELTPLDLEKDLPRLEERLRQKWKDREFFGPEDITGTVIPCGTSAVKIKYDKAIFRKTKKGRKKVKEVKIGDLGSLMEAWNGSIASAPASIWTQLTEDGYCIPGLSPERSRITFNAMRKDSLDSGSRHSRSRMGKISRTKVDKPQIVPVGTVGFLQKPAGKLRTIGNPNRLLQWYTIPLGEVLSDWVNSQPGVYVLNQSAGILQIQKWLSEGISLTSADLSSASDTLDFKCVLAPLLRHPTSLITRQTGYFDRLSKSQWFIGNDVARASLGKDFISWKQGQTLGLRPSFPTLTICNLAAAQRAVLNVEGRELGLQGRYPRELRSNPPFAIVGDDIVIQTKYAEEYAKLITQIGGVINLDKSMCSNSQAEFCSRLIEADHVTRLKPRWLEYAPFTNILSYQDYSIRTTTPTWIKKIARKCGDYAMAESGIIPMYHPANEVKISDKETLHAILSLERENVTPDKVEVSMETIYLRGVEKMLRTSATLPQLRRMTVDELLEYHRGINRSKTSEPNFLHAMRNARLQTAVRCRSITLLRKVVEQNDSCDSTDWATDQEIRKEYLKCCTDKAYALRFYPACTFPTVQGQEFDTRSVLVDKPASRQAVSAIDVEYDWKSDSKVKVTNEITSTVKLAREITKIEDQMVHENEKTHAIITVHDGGSDTSVEMLAEDVGQEIEISFHTRNQSTKPIKVAKRNPDKIPSKPKEVEVTRQAFLEGFDVTPNEEVDFDTEDDNEDVYLP